MTPHELRDRIQLLLATGCGVPAGRDLAQTILRRLNRTLGPERAAQCMAGDAQQSANEVSRLGATLSTEASS